MRLFSYIVARDYGFAPNPFFGVCTLATCKPRIRTFASLGDWVIGTGSRARNREGQLVFAMRITRAMTFDEYWLDGDFRRKRPNLHGSTKQVFGDNIYWTDESGSWHQEDSHHSYESGVPNPHNIERDTSADRVLMSTDFTYWGGSGPTIPVQFRDYDGHDICAGRGHKCRFPEPLITGFVDWLRSLDGEGYLGVPLDWSRGP